MKIKTRTKKSNYVSRLAVLFLFGLLSIGVLAGSGCTNRDQNEPSESGNEYTQPESVKDMTIYWNVDRELYAHKSETWLSSRPKDTEDGMYHFLLASTENRQITRRTASAQIKNQIDEYRLVVLELDEQNLIVGVKNAEEATGGFLTDQFYVEGVEDNKVTAYSSPKLNGEKAVIDLTGLKIFDCSARALVVGERTDATALNAGSRITCILDFDGTPAYLFITYRPKEEPKLQKHHICPECGLDVDWWGWNKDDKLPTTEGHYFLMNDVKVKAQANIEENQHIVLCLNGYNVIGTGKRTISMHFKGCALDVCDCQETGAIRNEYSKGHNGTTQGAVIWVRYGKLRLYSGTLDASKVLTENAGGAICANGGTTFEMLGGKVIGGAATYGSAIRISGSTDFIMSGGEIYGGMVTERKVGDVVDIVKGTGKISLTGGTVTGGLYLTGRENVTVGGTFSATGDKNGLYIADESKLTLTPFAQGAKIGITLENGAGVFTKNYVSGAETVFTPDDGTLKIAIPSGQALQLVEKIPHAHCVCGTGTVTEGGHTHETAVWQPWAKTDSLPKESGYYYLKSDITLKIGNGVSSGKQIYICLNGHNITCAVVSPSLTTGNVVNPRIAGFGGGNTEPTKFVLTNCGAQDASHGKISRSNTNTYNGQGAMFWLGANNTKGNTLELYNVRLDGRNYNTSHAAGGVVICVQADDTLKAYNVTALGGQATNGNGGAISMTGGTAEFYNSSITGGTAAKNGGAISLSGGSLTLKNTKVTGGKAATGNVINVSGGSLTVSGDTTVGEVNLAPGKKITVKDLGTNANVTVRVNDLTEPFATGLTEDLSSRFKAAGSGQYVRYDAAEKALYIVDPNASESGHNHCICGTGAVTTAGGHTHKTVENWTPWSLKDSLPTGTADKEKYYFLTADVKISSTQFAPEAGATVYLCLNGHKIETDSNGRLIALMNANVKYVITNCGAKNEAAGQGVIKNIHTERTYDNEGGMFWVRYATDTLELYNVIVDAGTHKIAKTGGLIYAPAGTVNAYGVTFKNAETTGVQNNGTLVESSGGLIHTKANTALYGCELIGGKTAHNGGSISVEGGTLTLSDTKVSGGSAKGVGNTVYLKTGTLRLSGNTRVDEIYLASGKTITVGELGESASVKIRMADGKGVFANAVQTDLSSKFSAADSSYEVRYSAASGNLSLASPSDPEEDPSDAHVHCICGTGTVTANGHTHEANQTWLPWGDATALPTESGYYYLTKDVSQGAVGAVAGSEVYLCLNGHKITGTAKGRLLQFSNTSISATNPSKYVITNCGEKDDSVSGSEKGTIIRSNSATYTGQGGTFWLNRAGATLELYNVIVDQSVMPVNHRGGLIECANSGATVRMYGTTLKNGNVIGTNGHGGAVSLYSGTVALYGSEIQNGKAEQNGGNIYMTGGTLILEDTAVSGGAATGLGNDIYVSGGTLNLGGKTVINGLYLTSGTTVAVSSMTEGAKISIELQDHTGVFANDVETDVSAMFEASEDGYSVKYDASAKTLSVIKDGEEPGDEPGDEPVLFTHSAHCVCGGYFSGDHASDCPYADADNGNGGKIHADGIVWEAWTAQNTLPTAAGYYYLENDVALSAAHGVAGQNQKVYLCLNGYTVTQTGKARISNINQKSRQLVITDCKERTGEGGTLASPAKMTGQGGLFHVSTAGSTLELYNIKVDGTGSSVTTYGGLIAVGGYGKLNAYGVTMTGGTTSTIGGGAIRVEPNGYAELHDVSISGANAAGTNNDGGAIYNQGTLKLYGVTLSGNKAERQGGNLYSTASGKATVEIYDSVIEDGEAVSNSGGNISIYTGSDTLIKDTVIRNGKAKTDGGNISVKGTAVLTLDSVTTESGTALTGPDIMWFSTATAASKVTVQGSPVISEIYLPAEKYITVGELEKGARIKIKLAAEDGKGIFANDVEYDAQPYFTGDEGLFPLYNEEAKTLELTDRHVHCVCAYCLDGVDDHTHEKVEWTAWTSTTALPGSTTESGYYYLTGDVTVAASVTAPTNGYIYLCLNGHKVQWTGNNRMIQLNGGDATQSRKYVVTNCGEKDYENQKGLLLNARSGNYTGQGMLFWTKNSDNYVLELYHVLVDGNTRESTSTTGGGNILVENGVINLYDVTIKSGGTSAGPGGSICIKGTGTMTIMDSEIAGGTAAGNGGTIYNAGTMTIKNSEIAGGKTTGTTDGGNLYNVGNTAKLTLDQVTLKEGKAARQGGNLYVASGTVVIKNSVIEDGVAGTDDGGNIAINAGTATVENTVIRNGKAERYGGNICVKTSGKMTLDSVTTEGGSAGESGNDVTVSSGATTGTLTVQGSTVISELFLAGGKRLTVGALTAGTKIAVRLQDVTGVIAENVEEDLSDLFKAETGRSVKYSSEDKTLFVE